MVRRRKRSGRYSYSKWPEYIPVAQRKKNGEQEIVKLRKKGMEVHPVLIQGRNIASTFWGKAWCKHIESYSDFENRLPRGRSYVRNGSVLDLSIAKGKISALVSGASLYKINIDIIPIHQRKWYSLMQECAGKIDSLIELLQGKFSKSVMEIITHKSNGLFPAPREITFTCSCPDAAEMCKHIAATLYGVGARLDNNPEQLFVLRHADHNDLIGVAETAGKLTASKERNSKKVLNTEDLSSLFGIELQETEVKPKVKKSKKVQTKKAMNLQGKPKQRSSKLKGDSI